MERLLCLLIGYLLGSFLTAEIVSRAAAHKKCSELGTGNPGMANIAHCLGIKCGLTVLAGDIGKTFLACLMCFFLIPMPNHLAVLYAGLGCILGHNFPFWSKFKGGKGVAVTCTAIFICNPLYGLLANIAGLLVVLLTGWLPLGAVVIPAVFLFPVFFLYHTEALVLVILYTLLMIFRHFPGLKSIKDGTCPKIDPLAFLKHKKNPE
ncbi:MAG TPA: glycerol-3-phosphate acyltransferase [Lachnospiraceae bacterium]|nr:glycerol-3-phosphate acyltransferase [Lachnospiraceae bacterium]